MEPISLTLSIATAIDSAVKLVEVLHDIKDGGKQRIRLIAEISSLWLVLENVKAQLDELSSSASPAPAVYLKTLSNPDGPLAQCLQLLDKLYDKCRPKGGVGGRVLQSLKWSFDKDEVDRYLAVAHRLQSSITLAYAQTSLMVLNTIAEDTAITRQTLEEQSSKQLLDWLSTLDFEAQQHQAYSEWCIGTVDWVLQLEDYKIFKEGKNPYLWLPSAPGCGKTTFCSLALIDLRSEYPPGGDVAVLGIYLTSRSTVESEPAILNVMGSLLKQLCLQGLGPDNALRAAYHTSAASDSKLSIDDIKSHIQRLLSPLKRTFVVIDAMDELEPHQQRVRLINDLKDLSGSLSIFMASRPFPEVSRLCAPLHHVCDVCDSGQASGFYHCDEHLRGGWDVCADCFAKGSTHCPTSRHPRLQYLASTITLWFEPTHADIRLYVTSRIEGDENLAGLLQTKPQLRAQVIDKIVDESSNK